MALTRCDHSFHLTSKIVTWWRRSLNLYTFASFSLVKNFAWQFSLPLASVIFRQWPWLATSASSTCNTPKLSRLLLQYNKFDGKLRLRLSGIFPRSVITRESLLCFWQRYCQVVCTAAASISMFVYASDCFHFCANWKFKCMLVKLHMRVTRRFNSVLLGNSLYVIYDMKRTISASDAIYIMETSEFILSRTCAPLSKGINSAKRKRQRVKFASAFQLPTCFGNIYANTIFQDSRCF